MGSRWQWIGGFVSGTVGLGCLVRFFLITSQQKRKMKNGKRKKKTYSRLVDIGPGLAYWLQNSVIYDIIKLLRSTFSSLI